MSYTVEMFISIHILFYIGTACYIVKLLPTYLIVTVIFIYLFLKDITELREYR